MNCKCHLQDPQRSLLYIGFNQDQTGFSVGTTHGFRCYNCDPFQLLFHKETPGGIGSVERLFRTSLVTLVGEDQHCAPAYHPNKIVFWVDNRAEVRDEIPCAARIRGVRLRRDHIVAVLDAVIRVYNSKLKLIDRIATIGNPTGICAVCPMTSTFRLACPHTTPGTVRIRLYDQQQQRDNLIVAHQHPLACIAMNHDGTLLATVSTHGNDIRLWDIATGDKRMELRRGSHPTMVHGLCFSADSQWLAVSSERGTIHIFSTDPNKNPKSKLRLFSKLSKHCGYQWSFSKFTLPTQEESTQASAHGGSGSAADGQSSALGGSSDINMANQPVSPVTTNASAAAPAAVHSPTQQVASPMASTASTQLITPSPPLPSSPHPITNTDTHPPTPTDPLTHEMQNVQLSVPVQAQPQTQTQTQAHTQQAMSPGALSTTQLSVSTYPGPIAGSPESPESRALQQGPIRSICAFTPSNDLMVLTSNGWFYHCRFDPNKSGPSTLTAARNFMAEPLAEVETHTYTTTGQQAHPALPRAPDATQ
eukprot:gnl/Trimastix_PCT/4542.p1 GENE.gnl/Trimastix_PCT/4542~~gnl/Trimastix_PCT/4542.p1  ORF type:complete len:533 (-),score=104.36 gnl/Trimastix_PCT/4542:197-1795(-)